MEVQEDDMEVQEEAVRKEIKKFKIEKSPRKKSLNLGPKPSLKGDF